MISAMKIAIRGKINPMATSSKTTPVKIHSDGKNPPPHRDISRNENRSTPADAAKHVIEAKSLRIENCGFSIPGF